MKFTKDKELLIISMYKKGCTLEYIGKYFNTYNTSIRRVLKRYNITIKGNDILLRLCKHNPFKNNDEYSNYYLGLLLTDGNIDSRHRIRLSLNENDLYLIEKFRDWASPKSKITRTLLKLNNSYMCSVSVTNEEAYLYLIRKGNFINKSFYAKLYVPLNYDILRGIIDGDGGFYYTDTRLKCSICGKSEVFMKQIYNFLIKEKLHPKYNISKDKLITIHLYRRKEVIELGNKLYKKASIFMTRKYLKWLSFYENKSYKYTLNSGKEAAL